MNNFNKAPLAIGLLLGAPSLSWGQPQLEETIVTAERRSVSVQDTALSVSAFSEEALDRLGINDVESLQNWVPNVAMGSINGAMTITTRGIRNGDAQTGGDPTTPVHIDGVYIPRPRSAQTMFFDLERVEFLRGPQGTLYGRNATAGSINLITQKPGEEFGGWADVQIGNYNEHILRGAVDLPLSDTVKTRVAGVYAKRDGFYDSGEVDDYSDQDEYSVRAHLQFDPTDELSILLSASYTEIDQVGPGGAPLIHRDDPYEDARHNTEGTEEADAVTAGLEINWEFGNVLVTSLTGYRDDDRSDFVSDMDESVTLNSRSFGPNRSESFSQELRFTSIAPTAGWNWLLGLYYFDEEQDEQFIAHFDGFPGPGLTAQLAREAELNADSKAVFANVTRDLSDTLELVLGVRYTEDERSRKGTSELGLVLPTGVNPFSSTVEDNEADYDNTDWNVGLNWAPTGDSLHYLKIGTGYKSGGFNADGSVYDPEEVLSYEIGTKNQFLDNRLQLNGALFYQEYKDMQRTGVEVDSTGGVNAFVRNAAEATTWGLEVESIFLATEALQFDVTLGYLNAELDEYLWVNQDPPLTGPVVTEDLSGNKLSGSFEWSFNLGAQYTWDLGDAGSLLARASVHWEDDSWLHDRNRSDIDEQDSFSMTDARLVWNSASDAFTVEAFVKNIEDEAVARTVITELPAVGPLYSFLAPRTYGVKVGLRW